MLHVRKDEKDFKYFSHTLLEHNDKIKRIAFVGGDRDMAQQSFLSPLTRCTFFRCKKHVEEDISRKIDDLGLKDINNEVLLDIFGGRLEKPETGIRNRNGMGTGTGTRTGNGNVTGKVM